MDRLLCDVQFVKIQPLFYDSSRGARGLSPVQRGNTDAVLVVDGMHDLAVSNVHGEMSAVQDNISRLQIAQGYTLACCGRDSGYVQAKMAVYGVNESGTVGSVRQACSAPAIRVSDELLGVIGDPLVTTLVFGCVVLVETSSLSVVSPFVVVTS